MREQFGHRLRYRATDETSMLYLPSATATSPQANCVWRTLRVLAVGDVDHHEFDIAREQLRGDAAVDLRIVQGDDIDRRRPWDLAVLFQSRPGSVAESVVERLRHAAPLAGLTLVLGTWCEGETRTGQPLSVAQRLFWYQFPPWWQANVAAWRAGRPTAWQHLDTGGPPPPGTAKHRGLIVIDAADFDTADALLAACEAAGMPAVWAPRYRPGALHTAPQAAIWVGRQLSGAEEAELSHLRQTLPSSARLVVLLDFPRHDRVQRAAELGADAVLGKPWRWEHLAECLTPRD